MPKQKHMSWGLTFLLALHTASVMFFIYKHIKASHAPKVQTPHINNHKAHSKHI